MSFTLTFVMLPLVILVDKITDSEEMFWHFYTKSVSFFFIPLAGYLIFIKYFAFLCEHRFCFKACNIEQGGFEGLFISFFKKR